MAAQTPVPGCTEHRGLGFVYVCKTCNNDLICMDCVVGRHNKHDLVKLTEFVSEQTRQIQQYEYKLSKSDIPKVESDIKENEENFKESSKEFRQIINDIKHHGEEMKKEIDLLTDRKGGLLVCLGQEDRRDPARPLQETMYRLPNQRTKACPLHSSSVQVDLRCHTTYTGSGTGYWPCRSLP